MAMKLGISSYTYGWAVGVAGERPANRITARDLVDRAEQLGVKVLQIADNLPAGTFEPSCIEATAAYARGKGIAIELGTRGSDPEHLRRFISLAHLVQSPILRVVLDTTTDHPGEDEVMRRLGEVVADAEKAHVTIAIENHDRFKAATLARIVRQLQPHIGVCLDTANSLGAMEGPEAVVETLGPLVVNLHLKDVAVKRVLYMQGFVVEGRPAGQGMLDIPWLLSKLKRFGRDCNAIAELWVPPEEDSNATIEKEARWAEESVTFLKRLIAD
jgi:3-oxoisoapionate decarboxylase